MEELQSSMINRRTFLKNGSMSAGLLASGIPVSAFISRDVVQLTILHTNDVHSRVEPFPMDGGDFQDLGGVAARSALISKIRAEEIMYWRPCPYFPK